MPDRPTRVLVDATDDELREMAIARGIDIRGHLCHCEVCRRTSTLCPATFSSIAMAIEEADAREDASRAR